jgi:molybdopterin-binding protein
VPTFTIGQAAELLGVSADTVRRWVDAGRLAATREGTGHRQVDGADLARFAHDQARHGDDGAPLASARNRFRGIVTAVEADGVMARVDLACGPHRVVSLMTREAADALGLRPGVVAVASVKATMVVVERDRQ